jgi:hypothetical protein
MLLRQSGNSLLWERLSHGGGSNFASYSYDGISATTGQRISTSIYTEYASE